MKMIFELIDTKPGTYQFPKSLSIQYEATNEAMFSIDIVKFLSDSTVNFHFFLRCFRIQLRTGRQRDREQRHLLQFRNDERRNLNTKIISSLRSEAKRQKTVAKQCRFQKV